MAMDRDMVSIIIAGIQAHTALHGSVDNTVSNEYYCM